MDLELLNWLKDGKYRIPTLKILARVPSLPSELATNLDVNRASMSRILRDLREKGLVEKVSSRSRTVTQKLSVKGVLITKELEDDTR